MTSAPCATRRAIPSRPGTRRRRSPATSPRRYPVRSKDRALLVKNAVSTVCQERGHAGAPRRPVLRLRRPPPRAVRSAVTDTAVVTGRNLRHFIRQPDLLVFSTIQPVLFVLLFVYVFGGAIGRSLPHGITYVDFLLPGIFVQSAPSAPRRPRSA